MQVHYTRLFTDESGASRFEGLVITQCDRRRPAYPNWEESMDPITTAILSVVPALAADVVKSGVKDAYEGFKAVIRRRWGETAPISKAIAAVEQDPTSKAQAAVLEEKVTAVNASKDVEVAKALHQLVVKMRENNVGTDAISRIQFNMSGGVVQGISGSENVQVGSMTFGTPPKN